MTSYSLLTNVFTQHRGNCDNLLNIHSASSATSDLSGIGPTYSSRMASNWVKLIGISIWITHWWHLIAQAQANPNRVFPRHGDSCSGWASCPVTAGQDRVVFYGLWMRKQRSSNGCQQPSNNHKESPALTQSWHWGQQSWSNWIQDTIKLLDQTSPKPILLRDFPLISDTVLLA